MALVDDRNLLFFAIIVAHLAFWKWRISGRKAARSRVNEKAESDEKTEKEIEKYTLY